MTKIIDIESALNQKFVERKEEIKGLLTAVLARQNILFIGPAGTGKSALSAELGKIITGSTYFQWLLTRFSTPEELFGVLSLQELEKGVYKRNTAHKLPEAHFAFLDEIFKANSAILNSLLTLINERIFYNNGGVVQSPLQTLIGSSNEYPEEGEGLEALFDRFLLRYEVKYTRTANGFLDMIKGTGDSVSLPQMSLEELAQEQFFVDMVNIPDAVFGALVEIRKELRDEGIQPSDRRFKQSLKLIQATAYMNGRSDATVSDLIILKQSLWVSPDDQQKTEDIINQNALDRITQTLLQRTEEIENLTKEIDSTDSVDEKVVKNSKLTIIKNELTELSSNNPARATEIKQLTDHIDLIQSEVSKKILGI